MATITKTATFIIDVPEGVKSYSEDLYSANLVYKGTDVVSSSATVTIKQTGWSATVKIIDLTLGKVNVTVSTRFETLTEISVNATVKIKIITGFSKTNYKVENINLENLGECITSRQKSYPDNNLTEGTNFKYITTTGITANFSQTFKKTIKSWHKQLITPFKVDGNMLPILSQGYMPVGTTIECEDSYGRSNKIKVSGDAIVVSYGYNTGSESDSFEVYKGISTDNTTEFIYCGYDDKYHSTIAKNISTGGRAVTTVNTFESLGYVPNCLTFTIGGAGGGGSASVRITGSKDRGLGGGGGSVNTIILHLPQNTSTTYMGFWIELGQGGNGGTIGGYQHSSLTNGNSGGTTSISENETGDMVAYAGGGDGAILWKNDSEWSYTQANGGKPSSYPDDLTHGYFNVKSRNGGKGGKVEGVTTAEGTYGEPSPEITASIINSTAIDTAIAKGLGGYGHKGSNDNTWSGGGGGLGAGGHFYTTIFSERCGYLGGGGAGGSGGTIAGGYEGGNGGPGWFVITY